MGSNKKTGGITDSYKKIREKPEGFSLFLIQNNTDTSKKEVPFITWSRIPQCG